MWVHREAPNYITETPDGNQEGDISGLIVHVSTQYYQHKAPPTEPDLDPDQEDPQYQESNEVESEIFFWWDSDFPNRYWSRA